MSSKKKRSLRGTGKNKNRVEAEIRVTKEVDFVQKEEFDNAEEPLPDVTLKEISRRKAKKEEKQRQEIEREKQITLTKAEEPDEEEETVEEARSGIVATSSQDISEDEEDEDSNVTDIRHARAKEKLKKRIKKISALVVVAAFAAGVYFTREMWVPKLEGIFDQPHETIVNDGKTETGNFPISLDESSVNKIISFNGSPVRLDENHIQLFDESGEEVKTFSHNYANPVAETAVKKMLVYDNGGTALQVINKKNVLLEITVEDPIILASIASNSNIAVVTQSEKYASVMTVYDSSGNEIYRWSSSSRILNVTFNRDGSGCYISTFAAYDGELKSTIRYLTFDSTEAVMKSETIDTLALDVCLNDDGDYWVVGDTGFYKLDKEGKVLLKYDYADELVDYDLSESCAAVTFKGVRRKTGVLAAFRSASESTEPDVMIYTEGGYPKKLHIENDLIFLLSENDLKAYDDSGSLAATADVSSEYVDFTFINGSVYFLGHREINKIAFET